MKRLLFNLLAGLSLLLCAFAVVESIRSHWIADFFSFTAHANDGGFTEYDLSSIAGSLHMGWMHSQASPPNFGPIWDRERAARVRVSNDHFGFGFYRQFKSRSSAPFWDLWLPGWFVLLMFASASLLCLCGRITKARVARQLLENRCACGYDLRATPQRCPECGTIPAKPVKEPA